MAFKPMARPAEPSNVRRAAGRLRDEAARALFFVASSARRGEWLTVTEARLLSRISASSDGLTRLQLARLRCAEPTMVGCVRQLVLESQSNAYCLGTAGLNFIDAWVRKVRPDAILEFGSGVSTVVLTACMTELHGDGVARVFSIDESEPYLHETEKMLTMAGLRDCVRLAHRPVRQRSVCGHLAPCYDLDDHFLRTFIDRSPEFVLVDGPSGGGLARLGTVPLAVDHLAQRCSLLLDDALRDDEIRVASIWAKIPGVRLGRIHLVGHGILDGLVLR